MFKYLKIAVVLLVFGVFGLLVSSCEKIMPQAPADEDILDGPVEGLSHAEHLRFLRGDIAFNDAVFTAQNGLGPLFVAASCGSCHAGDGKGHPFTTLTRFGQTDPSGNHFLTQGGPQLQNRALPGYAPETIPEGATSSRFTPPANTGLGFIELVADADLLAYSDSADLDGDGISGRPNWKEVPGYVSHRPGALNNNGRYICRFGKKAGAYNLLHQTVNAYNQDMGITSVYEPVDTHTGLAIDPEVTAQTVQNVVFYLQTLKAPVQRNKNDAVVQYGENLFKIIGCESCHRQTMKTTASEIAALSDKEFHPYTDLLLHDMGPLLDDGYTEGSAFTMEWRTPPLWGLGLSKKSQGGAYYLLHDGRATSIESAILYHGGEALNARDRFVSLSAEEKTALISFLESL